MRRFVYYNAASLGHIFVVDKYSLQMAYGLYKMSSQATNCIRVRRASDNAETDIGFSGVHLDVAALLAFVATGNGFVVKFYNQGLAGTTFDLENTQLVSQPLIVSNQTIYTFNGKIGMLIASYQLKANFSTFNNKSYGASIVVIQNNTTNARRDIFSFKTNGGLVRFFSSFGVVTAGRAIIFTRRLDSDGSTTLSPAFNFTPGTMIRTDIIDWANNDAFIRINNTQVASSTSHGTAGNTSATNSSNAGIGNIEGFTAVDRLYAWVLANTDISADISNIENDINSYYAIY